VSPEKRLTLEVYSDGAPTQKNLLKRGCREKKILPKKKKGVFWGNPLVAFGEALEKFLKGGKPEKSPN